VSGAALSSARIELRAAGEMLPPEKTTATRRLAKSSRPFRDRRNAERSGGLHQVARRRDGDPHRRADPRLRHENEVGEPAAQDVLGQLERRARGDSFGKSAHGPLDETAFAPGIVRRRSRLRLDADHAQASTERLSDDARAGRTAPPANRHDDRVDVGPLLDDLERGRGDASDEVGLVCVVDVAQSFAGGDALDVLPRRIEVFAFVPDFRAERSHRRHFRRIRARGDDDDDAHSELAPRPGEGKPVIARARRDDAAPPLGGREPRDEVHAAAYFERHDRQVILVLHPHLAAELGIERRVSEERRAGKVASDPTARVEHVAESRGPKFFHEKSRSVASRYRAAHSPELGRRPPRVTIPRRLGILRKDVTG
jgi:hypothetical protein